VEGIPDRPLARDRGQFERLYRQRLEHYRQADFTVPADTDEPAQVMEAILRLKLF
jgi:shikimate kinase